MPEFLERETEGKLPEDWSKTCCLFSPYTPTENLVEAIRLQVKSLLGAFIIFVFRVVKRLFQFFLKFQLFTPPNLKKYGSSVLSMLIQ